MNPANQESLEERVIAAAEDALFRQKYVSAIDVFTGIGVVYPGQVAGWRKGHPDFLEQVIQLKLKKITLSRERCKARHRLWRGETSTPRDPTRRPCSRRGEERLHAIGYVDRVLLVVHTVREAGLGAIIRIISVRKATGGEEIV